MEKFKMFINGEAVDAVSGKTYIAYNPANEEPVAEIALGDKADVDKAVAAAKAAFPIWSAKPTAERARILREISENIIKHQPELAKWDVLDHGSLVSFANMFTFVAGKHFEAAAELAKQVMDVGEINIMPGLIPYLKREPIGVVAAIVPWNIPMMIAAKIAYALATGNTVVAKPPSVDSVGASQLAEIICSHPELPKGAVNLVTGPGSTVGTYLAGHPDVGMVAFTGSCETGKDIMATASKTVKRLFLELGGKAPFIVLPDCDFEKTIAGAVENCYFNVGMLCGAPGRYYVHKSLYDKFVDRFIELTKKVVVGDPTDKNTTMGPVVSAEHRDRVYNFIDIGIKEGANLVYGGKRYTEPPLNKGYYIMPTIFTGVKQDSTLGREEIFGPVACIMDPFTDEDEVIRLANDSQYGLACSVWTTSMAKAVKFANAIQSGIVWINSHNAGGGLPWGGFKQSGFGKESTIHGMREYTQQKAVCMQL